MKRPPKQPLPEEDRALAADSDAIVQIKVWLLGVSPMVWRRVLVPECTSCTTAAAEPGRSLASVVQLVHSQGAELC